MSRIPSLDGVRGIAICFVLYFHMQLWGTLQGPDFGIGTGYLGVLIFFVLSGYLITTLLLKEQSRNDRISLGAFYWRRAARILPPFLAYLGGLALLTKLRLANSSMSEILWSTAFVGDYRVSAFLPLQNLWSLSVEEQFYILWPLTLATLSGAQSKKLLAGVIIASPIVRLLYFVNGASGIAVTWHFESVADGLAMGCLLALVKMQLHANRHYMRFINSWWPTGLPFVIWLASLRAYPMFSETIGISIVFLCVAVGIDVLILRCDTPVGAIVNGWPLRIVGRWSYSLYLWQQVFLFRPRGTQVYAWFPMNLALSVACAAGSFYLIEQPAIAWGRRASRRMQAQTSGTMEETAGSPAVRKRAASAK